MHVLLTGAGGFVGHHVLEHFLVTTDWKITTTDSFRHHGMTDRIQEVLQTHPTQSARVQVITHDLTVPWSSVGLAGILKFGPVGAIINVASESHVDRSISAPGPFVRNNVDLMLEMLAIARLLKPQIFLQLSTDEVYGAVPLGHNSREWDPILPSNPYSASKACQEALAIAWWRTYALPIVIVNGMNIVGERQHPEKFIPSTIKKILAGNQVLIHADPAGAIGSRHYIHARNVADAMRFLIVRAQQTPVSLYPQAVFPDRYNIVGELELNNLEVAQLLAAFLEKPLDYQLLGDIAHRPGHDLRYALDGQKLAETGWSPPVALIASLKRTVAWTLEHPLWLEQP
jgi:dTDP-glucose 4,6-dehydratase